METWTSKDEEVWQVRINSLPHRMWPPYHSLSMPVTFINVKMVHLIAKYL